MIGYEVAYAIDDLLAFKCSHCGHMLGKCLYGDKESTTGFEHWNFCPYCGFELY